MPSPSPVPRPTDSELEILKVLWTCGPSTVQQVHDQLSSRRGTGYTTVLKLLQIMLGKGLVLRDEAQRQHIYRAAITEKNVQRRLTGEFLDRVFRGSATSLVQQALSARRASPEELREIRELLDNLEGGRK